MEHMRACNPRGPLVVYVCKVCALSVALYVSKCVLCGCAQLIC